ncbi:cytosolic carboxypeptidase-like protein 5 [Amphibalanus amphitrite]|uniref:cytosolic carboxypeptidase-like protein 5 n=1 Tax=Amphibalanus amphitrite TaxID=1232801 RepID=UPI001C909E61|nr:cytosolic carboxypeptidase-like protein 5 [Amphibalanus amphitrite]
MEVETDGGFRISSNFDSGNLQRLEKVEPGTVAFEGQGPDDLCAHEFNCWVNPDCGGTEYENNNRTWFHFSFSGGPPFATVRFNIMNMNRQGKLYAQGMRTVYRVEPLFPEWKRLTDTHLYKVEDNNFIMSFKYYTLEDAGCTTYFAFSFPYSYTELQTHLNARDLQFRITPPIGIYYHRELLTYTLDGRRVDLLTITASDGGDGREHRLPGLFPLAQTEQRAVRFPGRKVVLLSARVHPGETPSSHVLNGCVRFLLSADRRAAKLRQMYVFKIIPMLNPDGVARGHYRTNIHGANLNRMYGDPARALHPEVHAAKTVAMYHHLGRPPADCEVQDSEPSVAEVDAQFVRPRELVAPPRPPEPEDVSNDASCFCAGDDESSLGMPDLSPLKSLLQMTPRVLRPGERTETARVLPPPPPPPPFGAAAGGTCPPPPPPPPPQPQHITVTATSTVIGNVTEDRASVQASVPNPAPNATQKTEKPSVIGDQAQAAAGSDSESLVSSGETERSAWSASSVSSGKDEPPAVDSNLFLYMDMHGHASKRGCFMYGNHFSCDETMVDCMLLPKLVSLNSANFDFLACNFTEKNMHHRGKKDGLSKEGSGRVALYRATGLVRSYTLECNYNTGRFCNVLPPLPAEPEPPADTPLVFEPVPYTPAHYEQVGEALMISILDLTGDNPLSRLPRSEYRDTAGVRAWIKRFMTVTKFGENNILFSPEKTARTMKVTERQRQAAAEERSPGAGGRNVSSTPAGGTGAQRRLALGTTSPGRCGADTKDRRRPPLRRVRKAKKLSPGKVEDQENATVARPANKRSADALLAPSAAVKTDPEINLDKETAGPASQPSDLASPAGPSQLRVKSPVLQPRFGQQLTQTGNSPAGLSRKPVRRALSEKRKVLKPTPVKLGESGLQSGAAPKLRRSGSLVNAASADAPLAETSVVNNLNLILGDKRQVAGLAWPEPVAGATTASGALSKRPPKRKKRAGKPEVATAKSDGLAPCRSLGHLIQMVSTPPSFANLFMASASTGELESSARSVGYAQLATESTSGGAPSGAWSGRSESTLDAQDESATLPDQPEPRARRHESCESSPLSFAGALSSASNSPRGHQTSQPASPASPKQPNSPKFGHSSPKYSQDLPKLGESLPKLGGSGLAESDSAVAGFGQGGSAPVSTTPSAVAYDAPVLSPRSPRMRRPSVKTRCSTRMAAKKSAKTLKVKRAVRPLADPAEPSTSGAGAAGESSAEKPAKAPRKKLARRASAPVGPDPLAALELMTSPGGSLAGDVTAAALDTPPLRAKVRKPRVKSKPRSPGACSVSVSGGTLCSLTADQELPDGPRRAVSEGHGSPEPGPALPPAAGRLLKKKQGKLARRTCLERGRPALQQVKKRKLKEKV